MLKGAIGNFSAPLLITLLVTYVDWRPTSFLFIIPGVVAILLIATTISEPKSERSQRVTPQVSGSLWLLALTFVLLYMMYKSFLTFLPTLLVQDGSTLMQAGTIASLMLVVGFVAQLLLSKICSKLSCLSTAIHSLRCVVAMISTSTPTWAPSKSGHL